MPKMSGGARPSDSIYVSRDVDLTLNDAEKNCIKNERRICISRTYNVINI